MKVIIVVTGPMRSGTSCVTGMLERCGFDLGRNVRILRKKTRYNPTGHFEPDLLYAINERLLSESSNNTNGEYNCIYVLTTSTTCSDSISVTSIFFSSDLVVSIKSLTKSKVF